MTTKLEGGGKSLGQGLSGRNTKKRTCFAASLTLFFLERIQRRQRVRRVRGRAAGKTLSTSTRTKMILGLTSSRLGSVLIDNMKFILRKKKKRFLYLYQNIIFLKLGEFFSQYIFFLTFMNYFNFGRAYSFFSIYIFFNLYELF